MSNICLVESLSKYIGQTVTIYTTSGGLSGEGFTGVLSYVCNDCIKLITGIGAAPACCVGSSCTGWNSCGYNNYSYNRCGCNNYGYGNYGLNYGGFNDCNSNWVGSVTEIPVCKIACFTHNAI